METESDLKFILPRAGSFGNMSEQVRMLAKNEALLEAALYRYRIQEDKKVASSK